MISYCKIVEGNYVDSFNDRYPTMPRPMQPCHRAAFEELEKWVEKDKKPPKSKLAPKPESGGGVNGCF